MYKTRAPASSSTVSVEQPLAMTTTTTSATTDLPDMRGLSLYQRKCTLINRAIDAYGMGRYQWCVWLLCGCGYFIDLLWAQAFGLVLSPLQQELGFGNGQSGNIATSFNAGLTVGAIFWGFMADIVGRRWAFNLTCLISSVFGLCLGASNSYPTFLVLTAFVGFGVGGNIPVDSAIFLEFVPRNRRFLLACLSLFQPLGVIVSSAMAFGFIPHYSCSPNFSEPNPLPSCRGVVAVAGTSTRCCERDSNMGWRYLLFTTGALSLAVFVLRFAVFSFKETPKFSVYAGRDDEAIATMRYITGGKGSDGCGVTAEAFAAVERDFETEMSSSRSSQSSVLLPGGDDEPSSAYAKLADRLYPYKAFFSSWDMARLTLLVWLTYAMDFSGFTVAGFYLPRILALKNGAANVSLRFTYAAYIFTYAPGILGVLGGAFMYNVPTLGRKWTMVFSSALMGTSIFLLATVDSVAKREGLFALEYFFQSMFNAVLYGWTPEAFPAPIRGAACGIAGFWGRLFGIVSPIIAQSLYGRATDGNGGDVNAVLYLAGGITLGCVLSTALLPSKLMESDDETDR
ncbi:membrane transporter [Cordyceps militaris CM01]|uniref:Membrane transporter n=1 Tax=Cordyceps militaris (strain CM01) TaxID=983644 RepID=G3J956_CORMM|nr:membrane transporter [Cordyceps militaris CM01]EGX94885.1 membrane transporter [Cordyceps militaris CM01]